MPEKERDCGKTFRVFNHDEIITIESTGKVRRLRGPTIFFKKVYRDRRRHEGCNCASFHFWREAWLKRAPEP